jgi:hypothetical protein
MEQKKAREGCLHEVRPHPTSLSDWGVLLSRRGLPSPLVGASRRGYSWWWGRGLWPYLRWWWWRCCWAPHRWRQRWNLLLRRRPPCLLRPLLRLLALRRRWWSLGAAPPLHLRRLLELGGRLPHEGAVTALEPPGPGPLLLAASGGGHSPRLVVSPGRGGAHILLVAAHRLWLLPFPFPGGG